MNPPIDPNKFPALHLDKHERLASFRTFRNVWIGFGGGLLLLGLVFVFLIGLINTILIIIGLFMSMGGLMVIRHNPKPVIDGTVIFVGGVALIAAAVFLFLMD